MKTLREQLDKWSDVDLAMYDLGAVLGLWPEFGTGPGDPWHGHKGVMWCDNPLGRCLYDVLCALREAGLVVHDAEEQRFMWNPEVKTP